MLDDLSTKEIVEPYRLFTSRAEYRLTLRQENADLRLCRTAYQWGILPEEKFEQYVKYETLFNKTLNSAKQLKIKKTPLFTLLRDIPPCACLRQYPEIAELLLLSENRIGKRVFQELLITAKYDGYLQREEAEIIRLKKLEDTSIPADFNYSDVRGLCNESRQKLGKTRPATLGQAGRIDGVTPADIGLLQVHLKKQRS